MESIGNLVIMCVLIVALIRLVGDCFSLLIKPRSIPSLTARLHGMDTCHHHRLNLIERSSKKIQTKAVAAGINILQKEVMEASELLWSIFTDRRELLDSGEAYDLYVELLCLERMASCYQKFVQRLHDESPDNHLLLASRFAFVQAQSLTQAVCSAFRLNVPNFEEAFQAL